jgi:hypothetical protein
VDGIGRSPITDLSLALPGSSFVIFALDRLYLEGPSGRNLAGRPRTWRALLLERSVLADPHRVRVNVQLIDAIRQQRCGVG